MRDIYKEVEYCTDLLSVLYDVPEITEIKVSKRMKKKFGMCSTKRSDDSFIRLTFASFILDDNYPKEAFYNTVVHELLHAIDHNKTTANGGHGGRWLEMAREVSDCLPFGDITRFASDSKVKARNEVMPKKNMRLFVLIAIVYVAGDMAIERLNGMHTLTSINAQYVGIMD